MLPLTGTQPPGPAGKSIMKTLYRCLAGGLLLIMLPFMVATGLCMLILDALNHPLTWLERRAR